MSLMADLRFALRSASKRPAFVATVCGTLALGVASATTMFAFLNSILLNPLPFPKSDELVEICAYDLKEGKTSPYVSIPDIADWKQRASLVDNMAYFRSGVSVLTGVGDPEPIVSVRISEDFLAALQIQPYMGRQFVTNEFKFGPDQACMISYRLWKRRFNSDPQIVGKTLAMSGSGMTIVAVLPASFNLPEHADLALTSGFINWDKWHRDLRFYTAIARLKPGAQLASAQAELTGIAQQLAEKYPGTNARQGVRVVPWKNQILGDTGKALIIIFGAVCCVLVIACTNVASLLLVRAVERKKEFAIRLALGGSRLQIASQPFTETLLLALAGGVLSIFLSAWCVKALVVLSPERLPRLDEVRVSPVVLIFCLAVSIVCGVIFGLLPVLQTFNTNVTESLNEEGKAGSGSHRTSWARSVILFLQVAMTVALMIGAGLFIRSYSRMQSVDLGFDPRNVVVSKIALRTSQFPEEPQRNSLYKPLLKKLEDFPDKKDVALATRPPFTGGVTLTFGVDGMVRGPGDKFMARINSVSDSYFNLMGMRVLSGRSFDATDNEKSPRVLVVNQSLVRRYLGSQNPIGQRITVQGYGTNLFTIVGVINDVHQETFVQEPEPELYFHYLQLNDVQVHVVAKLEHAMDFNSFAAATKKDLLELDPRQAAGTMEPLASVLARSLQVQRFRTYLLTCFAGIALMLSAVGIFGFLSYIVGQRTREIGILAALGAPRTYIVQMVMKETLLVIGLGVVIGLSVAFAIGRLIESFLFQVAAWDAFTFISVAVFVGAAATVAAYIPIRKAARLEVMAALRS
jgi:putative ABC transport system permease protein